MPRKIFMNDRIVPEDEARISVFDHGLLYGDGVFEGLRAYSGRVFRLDAHVDRLFASAWRSRSPGRRSPRRSSTRWPPTTSPTATSGS
jgi:branched-subunit amino acid aminotransferase/4-amino-4-deoxychorismate lyase